MLSRRSMIRALGFGVPAAAVVAAVGLPKPASGGYTLSTAGYAIGEAGLDVQWPVSSLSAVNAEVGEVTAAAVSTGRVTVIAKNLHPDAVVDFRDGVLHIGPATA